MPLLSSLIARGPVESTTNLKKELALCTSFRSYNISSSIDLIWPKFWHCNRLSSCPRQTCTNLICSKPLWTAFQLACQSPFGNGSSLHESKQCSVSAKDLEGSLAQVKCSHSMREFQTVKTSGCYPSLTYLRGIFQKFPTNYTFCTPGNWGSTQNFTYLLNFATLITPFSRNRGLIRSSSSNILNKM